MLIDVIVFPTPHSPCMAEQKVVVIDILRATSTIVTALNNKALEVIPVIEPIEVGNLLKSIGAKECITGGERKGLKIEGFDLGNSPREYSEEKVGGKKVILCTTNGTKAIQWAQGAMEVLIGSFFNVQVLLEYLLASGQDIVFVCSGRETNISLEDLTFAGMVIQSIQSRTDCEITDAARLALYVWQQASPNLEKYIQETQHGQYLMEIGMEKDIVECLVFNKYPILPKFNNGKISL